MYHEDKPLDIMRYEAVQEDEAHSRGKSKMCDGLTGSVSQSSAVNPTLPVDVITSYAIVVGAQGLYYAVIVPLGPVEGSRENEQSVSF
ncbi:hypothetical protein ElyMa_003534100 [Elysia marginata]|uniref:Uncharacterized protein n=1 Tax=Elysia marginata TaxID=1093978 RepID=A0AAV4EIQ0_9GAST|nr:hypothetical protein ElyMa_003534100 [Elysia marginata]